MLTILARTDGDRFDPYPREALAGLLATPDALVWVDLEDPNESEIALLSDVFGFHQLTIDDCLNTYLDPPKADDYRDYLFIIVQGIVFAPGQGLRVEMIETTELDIYLAHSYVVTFHHGPLISITEARERSERSVPRPARGADWLVHALLDALMSQALPAVEAMDEAIAALHDRALASADRIIMIRLAALNRTTLRFRRLVAPQRDLINRLSRGDFPHQIREETHMHFRDVYDHMVRLEGMIEGLSELSDGAITVYLATVNNRLGEITKQLSVTATIFLPLTLIASIFGTNFSPTYEAWGWWGFLAMCGFMPLCILGPGVWFKYRRWL